MVVVVVWCASLYYYAQMDGWMDGLVGSRLEFTARAYDGLGKRSRNPGDLCLVLQEY